MPEKKPTGSTIDWEKKHGKVGRSIVDPDTGRDMVLVMEDKRPKVYWENEKGKLVGPMPYVLTMKDLMVQPQSGGGAQEGQPLPAVGTITPSPEPTAPGAGSGPTVQRKDLLKKLKKPDAGQPLAPPAEAGTPPAAPIDFGFSQPGGK